MKKIRVFYDVDDVLNNLNERVFGEVGVDPAKIKYYRINKNKALTVDQATKIIELYGDGDLAYSLDLVDGANRITDILEKFGDMVEVGLHSVSMTEAVHTAKENMLKEKLVGFDKLDVRLELCCDSDKTVINGDEITVLVEDSLENVLKSEARYNILVDKPHNQFEYYGVDTETEIKKNIIRVYGLNDAVDTVELIVEALVEIAREKQAEQK